MRSGRRSASTSDPFPRRARHISMPNASNRSLGALGLPFPQKREDRVEQDDDDDRDRDLADSGQLCKRHAKPKQ